MVGEVFFGADEDFEKVPALADPAEGEGETFDGSVGSEPVFRLHAGNDFPEFGSHPGVSAVQEVVDFTNERREFFFRVVSPMMGEEVVEEDIDNDAGESSTFRGEKEFGLEEERMAVGKGIDFAMEHDALDQVGGIVFQQSLARSADEIAEQGTGPGGIGGAGEMEVGEEVQGLRA